jgi:putative heme-binding domain-containing protein
MPAFRSLGRDRLDAVVTYLRALQHKQRRIAIAGDAKNGKALFFGKAGCSACHMVNGEGGFIGSDLSHYATNHSPDEIRTAITDPQPDAYSRGAGVTATATNGESYRGVIRNEDNFSLQLQSLDGTFRFLNKSDLKSLERGSLIMPSDYGSRLSKTELDDLISYLEASAEWDRDKQKIRSNSTKQGSDVE